MMKLMAATWVFSQPCFKAGAWLGLWGQNRGVSNSLKLRRTEDLYFDHGSKFMVSMLGKYSIRGLGLVFVRRWFSTDCAMGFITIKLPFGRRVLELFWGILRKSLKLGGMLLLHLHLLWYRKTFKHSLYSIEGMDYWVFACSYVFPTHTQRIHIYGIFTYIWLIFMVNVGKYKLYIYIYTIHGSYGIYKEWMVKLVFTNIPVQVWFLLEPAHHPASRWKNLALICFPALSGFKYMSSASCQFGRLGFMGNINQYYINI